MICDRCGESIIDDEEFEYYGQTLCENCYIRALSPAKACDPWAVRSAQTLSTMDDEYTELSKRQTKILRVLEETGGLQAGELAQRTDLNLPELESELATLRHMEKIRGQMRAGKKVVCLWDDGR